MANTRQVICALVSLVVLCWTLLILFSCSRWYPVLVSPDEFIWSLKGFQQLLSCSDFTSGVQCFRRYRVRLLMELKSVVGESSFHPLTECFSKVLKEKKDSIVFLQLSKCLHESGVESLVKDQLPKSMGAPGSSFLNLPRSGFGENESFVWLGYIFITCLLMISPLLMVFLGMTDGVVQEDEVTLKDCASNQLSSAGRKLHPIIVKFLDEVYDLSNELDLNKWRDKFKLCRPQSKSQEIVDNSHTGPVYSLGVGPSGSSAYTKAEGESITETEIFDSGGSRHGQADAGFELRARTNINIHDPSRPVPSVLHFPRTDQRGKAHHRVFLPGRGWLSMAELERERRELLAQLERASWESKTHPLSPRRDRRHNERWQRLSAQQTTADVTDPGAV